MFILLKNPIFEFEYVRIYSSPQDLVQVEETCPEPPLEVSDRNLEDARKLAGRLDDGADRQNHDASGKTRAPQNIIPQSYGTRTSALPRRIKRGNSLTMAGGGPPDETAPLSPPSSPILQVS